MREMTVWLSKQNPGFAFTSEMIRDAVFTGGVKPDRETVRINLARMEELDIIRRIGKVSNGGGPGARHILWTASSNISVPRSCPFCNCRVNVERTDENWTRLIHPMSDCVGFDLYHKTVVCQPVKEFIERWNRRNGR